MRGVAQVPKGSVGLMLGAIKPYATPTTHETDTDGGCSR